MTVKASEKLGYSGINIASESQSGIVRLSTNTESISGTNDTTAITPSGVKLYIDNYIKKETWITYDYLDDGEVLDAGDRILSSTTASGFTLLLPPSPEIDNVIRVADRDGTWATNNLILDNNTKNVRGVPSGITCDINNASITVVYTGSSYGWTFV